MLPLQQTEAKSLLCAADHNGQAKSPKAAEMQQKKKNKRWSGVRVPQGRVQTHEQDQPQ